MSLVVDLAGGKTMRLLGILKGVMITTFDLSNRHLFVLRLQIVGGIL